jgi:hypothetical protein
MREWIDLDGMRRGTKRGQLKTRSTTDHKWVVKPKARFANQKSSSLTKCLLPRHQQRVRSGLALVP